MTPLVALKKMVKAFSGLNCKYCLVGGHAASLYRSQERLTRDVDFALVADGETDSRTVAEKALKSIGLKPVVGFMPQANKRSRAVSMITSDPPKGELTGLIDILLPTNLWVRSAVSRAQDNLMDFGYAKVPVITPEDLIVAKCIAVASAPDRYKDLDDLKELFTYVPELDVDYVSAKLSEHDTKIPSQMKSLAPRALAPLISGAKRKKGGRVHRE